MDGIEMLFGSKQVTFDIVAAFLMILLVFSILSFAR